MLEISFLLFNLLFNISAFYKFDILSLFSFSGS